MRRCNEPNARVTRLLPKPASHTPKVPITKVANRGGCTNGHLGILRPSPRSPPYYWALGPRMSCPGRMSPDPPCLLRRSLPPGPAPLLLLPSLGLAFRQYIANRAANRLYSPSRLCLLATHPRTAARRRHLLAVFGHSYILACRVPLARRLSTKDGTSSTMSLFASWGHPCSKPAPCCRRLGLFYGGPTSSLEKVRKSN